MAESIHSGWSLNEVRKRIITFFSDNNSVLGECALANVKRIYYYTLVAMLLRVFYILMFITNSSPDTPQAWSEGIIISHFVLLFFYIGIFIITHLLKNKVQPNITMYALQYLVPVVLMGSSVIIVAIDQLVTTNITPFLLSCIIVGAVFLLRPAVSLVIFLASYFLYFYLIAVTTTNQMVLLSNRVNGIATVGVGFLISAMAWYYNHTNIIQRRRIEKQQEQLEK